MNTAVVVFLVCALAGVAIVLLGSEWLREGRAQVDRQLRNGLADVDFRRWESEVRDA